MNTHALGDFQTPASLVEQILALVHKTVTPASVLEPTCGTGSFLTTARVLFPAAQLRGYEIQPNLIREASQACPSALLEEADFFAVDWETVAAELPEPVLLLGNPPWVTTTNLAKLKAKNDPIRSTAGRKGLDALTGKSNFDVSEWMLLRLIEAFAGRKTHGAFLVKTSVARRVLEEVDRRKLPFVFATMHLIDAEKTFGVSVDACLLRWCTGTFGESSPRDCAVYPSLDAHWPVRTMGVRGGRLRSDVDRYANVHALVGRSEGVWRSGIKHDCAAVMELVREDTGLYRNGEGAIVPLEEAQLYPLLKSSDVVNERKPRRFVLVTQRQLGDTTATLQETAPQTWAYLQQHAARLNRRRSSIYRNQPPFAMFGVGPYTFAPWKVAVSGLYKRAVFACVGPVDGKPVLFDDTCYFLPFETEAEARRAAMVLNGPVAQELIEALVFWDAKRPLNKDVLMTLELERLR